MRPKKVWVMFRGSKIEVVAYWDQVWFVVVRRLWWATVATREVSCAPGWGVWRGRWLTCEEANACV